MRVWECESPGVALRLQSTAKVSFSSSHVVSPHLHVSREYCEASEGQSIFVDLYNELPHATLSPEERRK